MNSLNIGEIRINVFYGALNSKRMENLIQGLKENVIGSILKLTLRSWLFIGLITVISTIISQGISYLLTPGGPGMEAYMAMMQDPEAMMEMATNDPMGFMQMMGGGAEMGVGLSLLIMLVGLTISSWGWVCNYMITAHKAAGTYQNLGDILGKSFNGKVFKLLGLTILMAIIAAVLFLVVGLLALVVSNAIVMFVLMFLVFTVLLMFGLIPAALVIGEMSFGEAFSFSFQHMKFRKALVLALIFIGIIIVIGLISVGIFSAVISAGSLGVMAGIGGLYMLFLITFINSLCTSIFSGLYFKYSEADSGEMNLEDHLIADNA